jgi:hypothetical protein
MIPKYEDYEAKERQGAEKLPAGGYIAQILKAECVDYDWGTVLVVSFDIAEGPQKGFFARRWKADEGGEYERRWKGTFRVNVPTSKSRYPKSDKDAFQDFTFAVNASNPGYTFDFDEEKLKGKKVGVLFRNREWEKDGNTGWTTECCRCVAVRKIQEGDYTVPADKPLKKKQEGAATVTPQAADEIISDSELPF